MHNVYKYIFYACYSRDELRCDAYKGCLRIANRKNFMDGVAYFKVSI